MTSKRIRLFSLFNFFDSLDFFSPIRIVYFYHVTNSYSQAANLLSIVWFSSALLEVPTGIFSDLIGRKKSIIFGSTCVSLAYVFYALGTSFWPLAMGAILHGTSRAFFSGNNDAYLYNSLEEEKKHHEFQKFYGKLYSLLSASAFIAALFSGILANQSFSLVIWFSFITQFCALLVAIILPDVPLKASETTNVYAHLKEAINEIKGNIKLRYLSLSSIFAGAGSAAYELHASIFSAAWPLWAVGVARALQELTITIGYYFSDKIIKKLGGAINVVIFQNVFSWSGSVIAAVLKSVFSPIFIISGFIFLGASDTASQTLLQKEFSDRQRATIASLNSLGSSLYFTIVLYIAGLVANQYGPSIGFLATQILFLPVIYYRFRFVHYIKANN